MGYESDSVMTEHHTHFAAEVKQETNKQRSVDHSFASFFSVSWVPTTGKTYDFTGLSLLDLRSGVSYVRDLVERFRTILTSVKKIVTVLHCLYISA